jgi:hypothetical protein
MTQLPRESNADDDDERELEEGVYYVRIEGDRDHMVASDICEVIQEHYNVRASRLGDDRKPARVPLEVKLTVRDILGRESVYAGTWAVVESEPGAKGLTLQTGMTNHDLDGVRAEVSVRIGL